MPRFIRLHKEVLKEELQVVVAYVNVDQITHIAPQSGKGAFTFVGLPSGFVEAKESPEEIMRMIRHPEIC